MKNLFFLFSLALAGCVTVYNPATQKQETYFIDESSEINIGKNMAQDILRTTKTIDDRTLNTFVNTVGQKVVSKSDRTSLKYNFYILDNKEMNAFALPGGYVFIDKGLLDVLNEDELAFVLGHEVGHVCARHSVKRLQTSLGINLLMSIALNKPDYGSLRQGLGVVYEITTLGYSRQDELLADYLGAKYAYQAGYGTKGAINALRKLEKSSHHGQQPFFLRSHPLPDERVKQLEKRIREFNS